MLAKDLSDFLFIFRSRASCFSNVPWHVLFLWRTPPLVNDCSLDAIWPLHTPLVQPSVVLSPICPVMVLFVRFFQDWVAHCRRVGFFSSFTGFIGQLVRFVRSLHFVYCRLDQHICYNHFCPFRNT